MKLLDFKWIACVIPVVIWGFVSDLNQKNTSKTNNFYFEAGEEQSNAQDRITWELQRLVDPATNRIPENIRQKELLFASQLPSDKYCLTRTAFWTARGPYNVGGRTRAFAADIRNENILLAGGVSGGLWRSEDGGSTWYNTTQYNDLHDVTCIAQDKRQGKNDTWYIGSGELLGNSASAPSAYFYGNGLYKSTDNGMTWKSVTSTASNTPNKLDVWDLVWNIAIDNSVDTADIIYAATYGNVFKSINGGLTWQTALASGSSISYYTDVEVDSKGVVYANMSSEGSNKGIWRSANGKDWINILPSNFPTVFERIVFGINPSNENEVYLLAQTPGYGKKTLNYYGDPDWNSLWKYTYIRGDGKDTNGTWINLSNNIPSDGTSKMDNFQSQGGYDLIVKVKPDEPNVVFIGGTNIYRSTDGFSTSDKIMQVGGYGIHTKSPKWKLYPNNHPDQHVLFFSNTNPDIMYNGNDGGLFKTTDCMADTVKWTTLNNGYLTTQTYTVAVDQTTNNDVMVAGFQDNGNWFTSNPNPLVSWGNPFNGDGSYCAIAPDSEYYVLSTQNAKLRKMTIDKNGNCIKFARIDPIGGKNYQFINPFVLDPNNKNILYLAGGKVIWRQDKLSEIAMNNTYDSISFGWQTIDPKFLITSYKITALAVSKNPANRVYFGTNFGLFYRIDDANSANPTPVKLTTSNVFPSGANICCIAVDPNNADKVAVVFSNYNVYSLFYSEDGGTNWAKVAGNLEENPDGSGNGPSLRWLSIMPYKGKTLYCLGTSVGLFATDNLIADSTVWKQIGANSIGNVVVEMVVTREKDGLIIAATHGTGIYSTKVSSVDEFLSVFDKQNYRQPEFAVYPNPAIDQIRISFSSDKSQLVDILVYDASGKNVYANYSTRMLTGNNQFTINTNNYNKGTYYIGIKSNNNIITRKFVKL